LFPLFGGYHGYMAAPAIKVLRHRLRVVGKWQATAEANENPEE